MKRKVLLLLLLFSFLLLAAFTNIHQVKHSWSTFLSFCLSAVCLQTLILHFWFPGFKAIRYFMGCYLLLVVFMVVVKAGWLDPLLGMHKAQAGLNHLMNLIKSPVPIMVLIMALILYQREKGG